MNRRRAYVGLGSNLDDPEGQIGRALQALRHLPGTRLTAASGRYRTAAMGPSGQPDYINAVVCLETSLTPLDLLDRLQAIETEQGRRREERWGARTLDLDLLLYDDLTLVSERLTLPHPGITLRPFVLEPLAELTGEGWEIPGQGRLGAFLDATRRQAGPGAVIERLPDP